VNCRHFGVCGGCGQPGVPYPTQLAAKQARLRRWFPEVTINPIVASPAEERFRHKVAFTFAFESASPRIVMGHYQAGSRRVVPIEECPVHSDRGNRLAFALRDRLSAARIPPGVLRHVLVRTTDDDREAVMMLVVAANHKALRVPVRQLIDSPDGPDGFFLNINDRPGPIMVGNFTQRIAGRSHVREDMLGTSFLISPTAFFQTNVGAARELLRLVLAEVGKASDVLDLYCGSGLFAIPLARQGARVTAVEDNRQAVEDAEANLRLNRVPRGLARFIAARAEDALPRLGDTAYDVAVLDPPRQGCPDTVIDAVCNLAPPRVVYVSCDPERMAAEVPRFRRGGYRLARVTGVDMFPHTDHIEAVAVFTRDTTVHEPVPDSAQRRPARVHGGRGAPVPRRRPRGPARPS
jgi:23S rRNA (uracil1939-C5)-methyltransferase